MSKLILPLFLLLAASSLQGCATVALVGAGAAGYAGWRYEWRTCRAVDGRWVSRYWARRHPRLAHCWR